MRVRMSMTVFVHMTCPPAACGGGFAFLDGGAQIVPVRVFMTVSAVIMVIYLEALPPR
jgi:hypothetical protein